MGHFLVVLSTVMHGFTYKRMGEGVHTYGDWYLHNSSVPERHRAERVHPADRPVSQSCSSAAWASRVSRPRSAQPTSDAFSSSANRALEQQPCVGGFSCVTAGAQHGPCASTNKPGLRGQRGRAEGGQNPALYSCLIGLSSSALDNRCSNSCDTPTPRRRRV